MYRLVGSCSCCWEESKKTMQLRITGRHSGYNDFQTNLQRIIILTSTTVISIAALWVSSIAQKRMHRQDETITHRTRMNTPAKSVQLFRHHYCVVYHFRHRYRRGNIRKNYIRKDFATNEYAATARFHRLVWNVKMIFASLLNDDRNNKQHTERLFYSRNSNETFLIAISRGHDAKKMSSNAVRGRKVYR